MAQRFIEVYGDPSSQESQLRLCKPPMKMD